MRFIPIILTTALLSFDCAHALDAREEIGQATRQWESAFNSRDAARVLALYAEDAVLWGTMSKEIASTPPQVARYFSEATARPDMRVSLGEQHIRIYGDFAVNTGTYMFSDVREGRAVTFPARFTFAFSRRDGRWAIVDHHSSRLPQ